MATQRQPRSQKSTASNHKTPSQENGHASENSEFVTQVHELKEALEQSQQKEKTLQETIEQLRSQVKEHDAHVDELKKTLEQSQQAESSLQKTIEQFQTQIKEHDTQVDELKKTLEQSQQAESSLQKTIKQLRSQVEDHDTNAKHLKANVEEAQQTALKLAESNQALIEENKQLKATVGKVDHFQAELDKAQQAAHQLAESNQSLIEENKALKQKQETPQKAQLAPAKADAKVQSHQDLLKRRQAASLAHPVFPDSPAPAKVSDQEMGWFD